MGWGTSKPFLVVLCGVLENHSKWAITKGQRYLCGGLLRFVAEVGFPRISRRRTKQFLNRRQEPNGSGVTRGSPQVGPLGQGTSPSASALRADADGKVLEHTSQTDIQHAGGEVHPHTPTALPQNWPVQCSCCCPNQNFRPLRGAGLHGEPADAFCWQWQRRKASDQIHSPPSKPSEATHGPLSTK